MRSLIFKLVSALGASAIRLLIFFQGLAEVLKVAIARLSYAVMAKVDPVKIKMAEAAIEAYHKPNELEAQQTELSLLAAAAQVRDHAREIGDWTQHHSEAITAVGDALLNECYWEEASVHQYLKEIVESIDGLEYHVEE